MRIKDKFLISYFRKRNIDENTLEKVNHHLTLNFNKGNIDLQEVEKIIRSFPNQIRSISIISRDSEIIRDTLLSLPETLIENIIIVYSGKEISIKASDLVKFPKLNRLETIGDRESILKTCELPSSVKKLTVSGFEKVDDINYDNCEQKPYIMFINFTRKLFASLRPEIAKEIDVVSFNLDDIDLQLMNIKDFLSKMSGLKYVENPVFLDKNVSDLDDITRMLELSGIADMSPELTRKYEEYYNRTYVAGQSEFIAIGHSQASLGSWYNNLDSVYPNVIHYPGISITYNENYELLRSLQKRKPLMIYIQNMADLPLRIAERLKSEGINCEIMISSHDNSEYQNATYTLREYLEMCRRMETLIGDIDPNLPEDKKFGEIYTRIAKAISYDYPAAYPKNSEERKYSEENTAKCRNMYNGLVKGKCVCAGFADILKNACLLKKIECEYIHGPIYTVITRREYYRGILNGRKERIVGKTDDGLVITKAFHAWNKVRINGIWYNCDVTADGNIIRRNRVPKYALVSDSIYEGIGRPNTSTFRCPCNITVSKERRNSIFSSLRPRGKELVPDERLTEFLSTLDRYGEVPALPIIRKNNIFTIVKEQMQHFSSNARQNFLKLIATLGKRNDYNDEKLDNWDRENDEFIDSVSETTPSWELPEETKQQVNDLHRNTSKIEEKTDRDDLNKENPSWGEPRN